MGGAKVTYVTPRIDLGSTICNTGIPDANGVLWYCEIPDGWDSPSQRGGTLDPTGRDGSVGLTSLLGGRELIARGLARATSSEAAWGAFYHVTSALPGIRGEFDLVVHEPTPKFLTVAQHGQPRADPPRWTYHFAFQITLRADMPLKRGLAEVTDAGVGTLSLTNSGRSAAYPVITTTSAGTVDLAIGTRQFTTTDLPSGAVIDMWARTITAADGSSLYGTKTAASEWLAIPPGTTALDQNGTAAVSVSIFDTYA